MRTILTLALLFFAVSMAAGQVKIIVEQPLEPGTYYGRLIDAKGGLTYKPYPAKTWIDTLMDDVENGSVGRRKKELLESERRVVTRALVSLWDEYKRECWADSSLNIRSGQTPWLPADTNLVMVIVPCWHEREGCTLGHFKVLPRYYWTHKQPDPFDFLDRYLRKKAGK